LLPDNQLPRTGLIMQILMGPQQTLIYVDESKMSTNNLFHFIENQFSSYHIHENHLLLHYSRENHYKHIFLIKWLYSLHKKTHNKDILHFKEVLVNRIEKPVKIITKNEIKKINTVVVHILNDKIRFQLLEKNNKLLQGLICRLTAEIEKISYENNYFEIGIRTDGIENKIDSVLDQKQIDNNNVIFQCDKNRLKHVFESQQENDLLLNALKLLNSHQNEHFDVIKMRYKKLLIQFHPDNVYTDGFEKIKEYTDKFQTLQHSYDVVKRYYQ